MFHKASRAQGCAQAVVRLGEELFELLKEEGSTSKGPVFQTAIIAGIQGAKNIRNYPNVPPFALIRC